MNKIKQLNRLQVVNTKLIQGHLKSFVERGNRRLFEEVLNKIFNFMPEIFTFIKNCDSLLIDKRSEELGDKNILFLQFYRCVCEEQNRDAQLMMSESGMLRKLVGLFEILLKSPQTKFLISKHQG